MQEQDRIGEAPPVIGLESGVVRLAPHAAAWRSLFEAEREAIVARIGAHVLDVQHVGSTSIPGIAAKPIIDVAVAVRSFEEAVVCIEPLVAYGYGYHGELGIPRRHYFTRGEPRSHHLHMVEIDGDDWRRMILFRDHLRAYREDAIAYEELKKELASRFRNDREAYTEGKSSFITSILLRAERHGTDDVDSRAHVPAPMAARAPGTTGSGSDA